MAYKLARALMAGREDEVDKHLDLVALGTIADVAPLNGENRILTKLGLKKLRNTDKPGLKALMEVAKVDQEKLTCRNIGFALGPRINAMGRVGSANVALELIMCTDDVKAMSLARMLDKENSNRQAIERGIVKEAVDMLKADPDKYGEHVIIMADSAWHPGVIGIVASRITEQFNKPAILIALDGEQGKGSGRAVDGFNLFKAIDKSSEHLVDFGGHEAACGVKIEKEKVDSFRKRINEIAEECFMEEEEQVAELKIDLNIPFSHIGVKLINELELLSPHGPTNTEPVFSTKGIRVKSSPREIGRGGLKFLATCGTLTCEAITFRKNSISRPKPGDIIDLAYTPSINSWAGIDSIQLNIKDLQIVEG